MSGKNIFVEIPQLRELVRFVITRTAARLMPVRLGPVAPYESYDRRGN
jgi:hypothetical protein